MAKVDPALWRDMLGYLHQEHAPICRQWFENLSPLDLDHGLLKIHINSKVHQNYLQNKCVAQFVDAAQYATGNLVAVQFVTERVTPKNDQPKAKPDTKSDTDDLLDGAASDPEASLEDLYQPSSNNGNGKGDPSSINFDDQIVLSPDYSFDTFISGPANDLAHAASRAVADRPGFAYNPLFIHGGVGLGKTHLLQAICQTILEKQPDTTIHYVSCDAFLTQFIECVQRGEMNQFRHRYRDVDVLVIDDIHFLANRERSQEEFFHTFNALYQSNRQIVLSSDSPPSEIPQLEDRLVSRFGWGLVAKVSKPDYETRVAIVRAKAQLRNVELPEPVIELIARRIDSNARELEGAITTLQGHIMLRGDREVTVESASAALADHFGGSGTAQITMQDIADIVTRYYSVKLSDLQSKRRHKSITEPRQVCMWLVRRRTRYSLEEIGGFFGGRDHTTVMHSLKTIDDRMASDEQFGQQINQLSEQVDQLGGGAA